MTPLLTRTYTGLFFANALLLAGCVLDPVVLEPEPEPEPDPDPSPTLSPDPIRESPSLREFPAGLQKLSPGIRGALDRETDVITIGNVCDSYKQPDAPELQNAPKPKELLISFENRLPRNAEFEVRGFEQVRRGVEGWSVVIRSTQAESPNVSRESVLELAEDPRVSNVEVNCIYPFEESPGPTVEESPGPTVEELLGSAADASQLPNVFANPDLLVFSCTVTALGPPPGLFGLPVYPFDSLLVGNYLWGLEDVGAYDAWDAGRYTSNVPVAVIDSGVDYNHP